MIVSLDELKAVLGIALDNTDEDAHLTSLIESASTWFQETTHRYWDVPVTRVEYQCGKSGKMLYLDGTIDDSPDANPASVDGPSTSLHIFQRSSGFGGDWTELIEGTDWERRDQTIVKLAGWCLWQWDTEYKFEYLDGWLVAPADVKAVVLELAINQYQLDLETRGGTAGITSESLGDFSYNRDLTAVAAGSGTLSNTSMRTINNRTRKLV